MKHKKEGCSYFIDGNSSSKMGIFGKLWLLRIRICCHDSDYLTDSGNPEFERVEIMRSTLEKTGLPSHLALRDSLVGGHRRPLTNNPLLRLTVHHSLHSLWWPTDLWCCSQVYPTPSKTHQSGRESLVARLKVGWNRYRYIANVRHVSSRGLHSLFRSASIEIQNQIMLCLRLRLLNYVT